MSKVMTSSSETEPCCATPHLKSENQDYFAQRPCTMYKDYVAFSVVERLGEEGWELEEKYLSQPMRDFLKA